MRQFLRKSLTLAGLVLVVVAAAWWWRSRDGDGLSFTTVAVKRGDIEATIGATGTIEPLETVDVGAQVAGRIIAFGKDKDGKTVDYGSVVEKGALLAKIDDSVYAADLSVARAGLQSAEADLEQMQAKLDPAAAEWKRAQNLYANRLMAQVDYDAAGANYKIAQANVAVAESGIARAKADLEKAQRNLDFCAIHSPVSGVIIDRRVNAGQTVVASLNAPSLFLIARDLTRMQIWVPVNEADVGHIKKDMPVAFTVDTFPGQEFQGTVDKVRLNAQMTQNVVLYTVEIDINNPDKKLLPYLTASVHFISSRETGVLLVPNKALRWSPSSLAEIAPDSRQGSLVHSLSDPGSDDVAPEGNRAQKDRKRILWVKDGDFVRPVQVTTGVSDGANTMVSGGGLREGEQVVTGEDVAKGTSTDNPFLPKSPFRH